VAETTAIDDWLAVEHPGLVPDGLTGDDAPGPGWEQWGRGAILFPQTEATDGMALFRYTRR
jgi:hypothetical protein